MYTTMWLVFVLVAVIYSRETDGCSCSFAHPQVQFCNAAFGKKDLSYGILMAIYLFVDTLYQTPYKKY